MITRELIQDIVWNDKTYLSYTQDEKDRFLECVFDAAENSEESGPICNQLGAMYAEGIIVDKDPEKAFEWYKKASRLAYPIGTSNLGCCYMYGLGTKQNYDEAFKCFAEAAAFGVLDAIIRLGDLFYRGICVSGNGRKAFLLYWDAFRISQKDLTDLSAYQAYSDAAIRLGDCFYYGYGVDKDDNMAFNFYSEAYRYFVIRKDLGDSYCTKGLKESRRKLMKLMSETFNGGSKNNGKLS